MCAKSDAILFRDAQSKSSLRSICFPPQNCPIDQEWVLLPAHATMDSVPSELSPPQLFYLMVLLLRAIALQAGVFLSPVDAAWEQSVPDGTRSAPAGCTIGDNSTLRTALQCIQISDSEEEPDEVRQTGTSLTGNGDRAPSNAVGPREPSYPPPNRSRTRQRSSSTSREPRTKRGRK